MFLKWEPLQLNGLCLGLGIANGGPISLAGAAQALFVNAPLQNKAKNLQIDKHR